ARLGLVIGTAEGSLKAREAKVLAGWKPSVDGSDPLDRLLPDGRLLRVEMAAPSPYAEPITRALFAALDRNGDGKLTPDELKDADKILLRHFDEDEDGCLTPLEIVPDLLTVPTPAFDRSAFSVSVLPSVGSLPHQTARLRSGEA